MARIYKEGYLLTLYCSLVTLKIDYNNVQQQSVALIVYKEIAPIKICKN